MSYSVSSEFSSILKVKRSEFICHLFPLPAPETITARLKSLRKAYPKARHFCWAYRYQENNTIQENASDAGEPSGSAGLPILKALKQADLVQTGAVVVRLFGGIKLGKRGLINAYYEVAHITVSEAKCLPYVEWQTAVLHGPLSRFNDYRILLERFQGNIIADRSHSDLKWTITIPKELYQNYAEAMSQRFGKDFLLKREE